MDVLLTLILIPVFTLKNSLYRLIKTSSVAFLCLYKIILLDLRWEFIWDLNEGKRKVSSEILVSWEAQKHIEVNLFKAFFAKSLIVDVWHNLRHVSETSAIYVVRRPIGKYLPRLISFCFENCKKTTKTCFYFDEKFSGIETDSRHIFKCRICL